jgi:putative FmdB family regulatory protein
MLTYEYECEMCGLRFERQQAISEDPLTECPECRGKVRRLISAGQDSCSKGPDLIRQAGVKGDAPSNEQAGPAAAGRNAAAILPAGESDE